MAKLVTTADLDDFGDRLLQRLEPLLRQRPPTPPRKWLKSHDVRRLLMVSPNTLTTMRVNGTLPYAKIGGILYYDPDDIIHLLNDKKKDVMNQNIQRRQWGMTDRETQKNRR